MGCTFYMMVGLPASGKSTTAEELVGCTVLSSDKLREAILGDVSDMSKNNLIFDILYNTIKDYISDCKNVVLDSTNISASKRKELLDDIEALDCKRVCVYMKTDYALCLERNSKRERPVPNSVMESMHERLEDPTLEEGWDEIITIQRR